MRREPVKPVSNLLHFLTTVATRGPRMILVKLLLLWSTTMVSFLTKGEKISTKLSGIFFYHLNSIFFPTQWRSDVIKAPLNIISAPRHLLRARVFNWSCYNPGECNVLPYVVNLLLDCTEQMHCTLDEGRRTMEGYWVISDRDTKYS